MNDAMQTGLTDPLTSAAGASVTYRPESDGPPEDVIRDIPKGGAWLVLATSRWRLRERFYSPEELLARAAEAFMVREVKRLHDFSAVAVEGGIPDISAALDRFTAPDWIMSHEAFGVLDGLDLLAQTILQEVTGDGSVVTRYIGSHFNELYGKGFANSFTGRPVPVASEGPYARWITAQRAALLNGGGHVRHLVDTVVRNAKAGPVREQYERAALRVTCDDGRQMILSFGRPVPGTMPIAGI
jgi:hypothetical protein